MSCNRGLLSWTGIYGFLSILEKCSCQKSEEEEKDLVTMLHKAKAVSDVNTNCFFILLQCLTLFNVILHLI